MSSYLGAFLSYLSLFVLVFYGSLQMYRMFGYGETVVTMSMRDSYFTPEDVYPYDVEDLSYDNFDLAFGLTDYDGNEDPVDDPRYGKIRARYVRWGFDPPVPRYLDLTSHRCTEEELGVDNRGEDARFYPIHDNSLNDTRTYGGKLFCLDDKIQL